MRIEWKGNQAVSVIIALAWYADLPKPHDMGPAATYSVEYILTKNGNHTQIQSIYSDGGGVTEQVYWLNFDNRTAVYNYFGCTPSSPSGCKVDDCPFTILGDTPTEYRVKVTCTPGA